MKILVTGFNPFGGEKINPALEAVKLLPSEINGAEVRWVEIPTVFYKSSEVLEAEILRYQPDAVLCIGQAGGRTGLTPERVAINQDDARIPDNEGNQPIDTPIRIDGASAYFSSLPMMYQALYLVDKKFPNMRAGFMHIPYMMEQVVNKPNTAGMSLCDIVRGIEVAIEAIVDYKDKDLQLVGGETH
ncbi:pyroglutamyl-peptidase I [Streptococcus pneumoniae]|nr:pyroglutamyl-peptidase I [Streptococcus pneumoniae]